MILNGTPHTINVVIDYKNGERDIIEFESDLIIRVSAQTIPVGTLQGYTLTKTVFGEVEGLPEYEQGTYYIVSQLVKSACPNRIDLLVPNELVRNEQGKIIGCRSFSI